MVSAFVDMTSTTTTPQSTVTNTNSTTAVTAVAAPAASTQRKVNTLSVYNADTATATVTVRYNDNGTLYPIVTLGLASGATLFYTDPEGWRVIRSDGSILTGALTGTAPGGTNGQVQYNNAGTLDGASSVKIEGQEPTVPNISPPTAPSSNKIKLYGNVDQGVMRLDYMDPNGEVVRLARDQILTVKNDSGSTINKGQWVYLRCNRRPD